MAPSMIRKGEKMRKRLAQMIILGICCLPLRAAVGCELNDPDRDVKRLFPASTGYKTIYASILGKGGVGLLKEVEGRLGDRFQGLFETADVPYTLYRILEGQKTIGYIHGVNQKGRYGGVQIILALDPDGRILAFYYQRLTNSAARLLRAPEFGRQFIGLDLRDFDGYDVASGRAEAGGRIAAIQNPAPGAEDDFRATLRAVKKNLILSDEFLLGNKFLAPERGK
jgi:hypothetical protein